MKNFAATDSLTPQDGETASPGALGQQRQEAEAFLSMLKRVRAARPPGEQDGGDDDLPYSQVLHELLVHQVQLEMQNEELRRVQESLIASEARYSELYDNAPVGYLSISESGLIKEANLTASRLLGLPRDQLVGSPVHRAIFREDQDAFHLMRRRLAATGASQTCALRLEKQGADPFWARLEVCLADRDSQEPVCLISFSDISEIRRKDDALRESELKFRTIADFTYDWEYWVGANRHLIYMSPSCERITGYSREEFLGDKHLLARIVHPDDAEKYAAHVDAASPSPGHPILPADKLSQEMEFRIVRKDGSLAHIEHACQPVFDERGTFLGRRVSNRDVTVRKLAEMAVGESERLLKESQIAAGLGSYMLDIVSGRWTSSEGMDLVFGIGPAYLRTVAGWTDLVHPEDRDMMLTYFREEVLGLRQTFNKEYRICRHSDQATRWVHGIGRLECDASGSPAKMIGTIQDITGRKRVEMALREKNEELQRFTNTVTHDLKSPLVTVKTFLAYLEDDLARGDSEAVAKDIGYIRGAAKKMGVMVAELLELARIGHMRSAPESVTLREVVQEALDIVAGQIAARRVRVEVAADSVWLHGDRPRLVEIFQNLLDNSVKFMGDQPSPLIEIGTEWVGGEIVLFVRDNGKGIEPAHIEKLFGIFQKLDPRSPGSGIGLAMVRRIVEAHGGRITAHSDGPGRGITFRFTLEHTKFGPT